MRRGQTWSVDYALGLLLFVAALIMAVGILSRTGTPDERFTDLVSAASALSDQLMQSGYPEHWRADVVTAGLLTEDELSLRKLERLQALAASQYDRSKSALNLQYEYAIVLRERDGTVLPVNDACYVGSPSVSVTSSPATRNDSVAYYHRGAGTFLSFANGLNFTVFSDAELGGLLDNASRYDLLIFDNPDFSSVRPPYDGEKADALHRFVLHGGTALLVGDVSLLEAFGLNETAVSGTRVANATGTPVPFFDIADNVTDIDDPFVLNASGQQGYVSAANVTEGGFAVHFTYGDGEVYYLGSLDGRLGNGTDLAVHIRDRLRDETVHPSAACVAVTPPSDVLHAVVIERLVPYKGRILSMRVHAWQPRLT